MKRIIHGILRLLLAIGGISIINLYIFKEYTFSGLLTEGIGGVIGVIVTFQLCACFVLYMGINGVRELMRKGIRFRVMYVVSALMNLSLLAFAIFSTDDSTTDTSEPASGWEFLFLPAFAAILYFIVADFITLFIKRKKQKFYSDSDFETVEAGR